MKQKDIENIHRLIKETNKFFLNNKNHYNNRWLIGAMLISKKRFAFGFNRYDKSHTLSRERNIHAEVDCIVKWLNIWDEIPSDAILYTVGLTRSKAGFCKSSRPCEKCLQIIKNFGIKKIVYLVNNENKIEVIREEI